MDTGSDRNSQIPSSWVPVTPLRPILPKPPPICADRQQNWFLPERFPDGFAPDLRANSHGLPGGARLFSDFMELDRLRNVTFGPLGSLIALADASVSNSTNVATTFGSNDGRFASGGNSIPTRPIYDLNSLPVAEEDQFPSTVHPFLFAPLTPGPAKTAEVFQGDFHNSSVNEITEKMGNEVGKTMVEVEELQHGKEHQKQIEDPSNAHKELQENHNPGVDLNQTPSHKPRRKKHRPKVIIEGQPKKTPKPRTPIPEEKTPRVKRKYVRKSTIEETVGTTGVEVTRESNDQNTTLRETRSCRRKLNYEFETASNIQLGQATKEKTQLGVSYDTTSALGKEFEDFVSKSEREVPTSQKPVKTDLLHELRGCIQDEATRGKCRIVFSEETHDKQGSNAQIMRKMDNLSAPSGPNDSNYSRNTSLTMSENAFGSKRAHSCTNDKVEISHADTVGGYSTSLRQFSSMFPPCLFENNGNQSMYFPAIYKKKRTEKTYSSSSSSTYSSAPSANISARQPRAWLMNNASVALYTPGANFRYSANQFNISGASTTGSIIDDQRKQQLFYFGQRMTKKRSKGSTRPRNMASQTRMIEFSRFPTFQSGGASTDLRMQRYKISNQYGACMEALVADHHATLTTKKRTKRSFSARSENAVAIWNETPSIDEIVEKLRRTDINSQSNRVTYSEKGAIVPYNFRYERANALVVYQRDGTLVPYGDSFNPLRKRKPRPKVDIDEETDRVWKLLLENINSEGIDGTDEDKAKWWEDERSVFQGRADSFIARMHLVQGDRRFSPWKGSVLDSVVGVFLTQNVSDHLSSSAFMALAARFPLKEKSNNSQCSEGTSTLSKELEACILINDDSNKLHEEKSSQSPCSSSPVMIHETAYVVEKESVDSNESHRSSSSGNGLDTHAISTENKEVASSAGDDREMDGVLSCQHSEGSLRNTLEPSLAQTAERAKSCLEDVPEADKITSSPRSIYRSSFLQLLQEAETLHARKLPTLKENADTDMAGTEHDTLEKDKFESANPKVSSSLSIPCSNYPTQEMSNPKVQGIQQFNVLVEESSSSETAKKNEENCTSEQSGETAESVSHGESREIVTTSTGSLKSSSEIIDVCSSPDIKVKENTLSHNWPMWNPEANIPSQTQDHSCVLQQVVEAPNLSTETLDVTASSVIDNRKHRRNKEVESGLKDYDYLPGKEIDGTNSNTAQLKTGRIKKQKHNPINWDSLRLQAQSEGKTRERTENTMDSLDWEAVRHADVNDIAYTIRERGMNNMLAERIKDFLNRLVREHGSTDLEWLRDVPPDKAKEYLLSIRGLGLKSVECVRLLTLHHLAFPVDTNVGRIAVRLGWVPLQPLPESLQLHLLELYPVLESIQRYLWPRLCKLDQRTLYELHYQMITFGKVFCTKSKPNCNACPMRGECRHFASAFASARLSLPGPEEKGIVSASQTKASNHTPVDIIKPLQLTPAQPDGQLQGQQQLEVSEPVIEIPSTPEPIVEVPATPEPEEPNILECDIEDTFYEDPDEIPTINLNIEQFAQNLQNYMQNNMELQEGEMSRALVSLTPDAASIPMPKLKNVNRLRTEHHVYELPDSHPLLEGLDKREPDDPCSYLLAIWTPGETANSIQPPDRNCRSQENGTLCDEPTCFSCNSIREAHNQTVRGTLLIPCRTAMRGSFPLNGTYFQVNEVFADHESSIRPIDVPRSWLWNLPRRTVYFGTSIPTIFKGFSTESIQYCFWRGFVCVRGFDQKTRAPRPLMARLHFPASKLPRTRGQTSENRE